MGLSIQHKCSYLLWIKITILSVYLFVARKIWCSFRVWGSSLLGHYCAKLILLIACVHRYVQWILLLILFAAAVHLLNNEDGNVWVHSYSAHDQLVLGLWATSRNWDHTNCRWQSEREINLCRGAALSNLVPGDKVQWSDQVCVWCYLRRSYSV